LTRLLVATHNALLLVDPARPMGRQQILHWGAGLYYGITWDEERLYLVARGAPPERVLVFDRDFRPLDPPPFKMGGEPHQCLWLDGTLYVTDTTNNRVLSWDGKCIETVFFVDAPYKKEPEHLNSIWSDGDLIYVLAHRKERRPKRVYVLDREFALLDILPMDFHCLAAGAMSNGLHNVYVENGRLYTLGPSVVLALDLVKGKTDVKQLPTVEPFKHYLRGLARTEELFYIGVSNVAARPGRDYGSARILIQERMNSNRLAGEIVLDERCGQVLEIRALDEPDLAHNGVTCPLDLAALPDLAFAEA
jgi:hypothetical protein